MTEQELRESGQRLARAYERHVEYVQASTVLISALPIIYGILTFIFGDALWESNPIYRTALEVPWAPQSWGGVFVVLGVSTIVCAAKRRHLAVSLATIGTAVALAGFMVSFLIESVRADSTYGLPPAAVYGIFSVAFLNRSRFAWGSFRDETGWQWWWERSGGRLHWWLMRTSHALHLPRQSHR